MTMTIQFLDQADLDHVVTLGRRNAEECFPHLVFSEARVRGLLNNCLTRDTLDCIVAKHNGEVVGYLVLTFTPHAYAEGLQASIAVLYVRPESRGTSAAVRMIRLFTKFALDAGCVEIHAATNSGKYIDQSKRLYERMGYTYRGTTHILIP